ncbi:MAG TPA: inorganic pyrophosphatase [Oligoflexia bacterium]|mgnify:CR=1 FL=1|nr:inorganic pyrophosphatase [Oligoflexia bacterium]HMP49638.1 inorganic pyrophosphatase [Oligoflexia bacterium]
MEFNSYRPHPWHGLSPGDEAPGVVLAYIEITPFDTVKYEVDKVSGYLKVDRPQTTSSLPPTLYGFIPQTYCGDATTTLSPIAQIGDGDPLDICVISSSFISKSDITLRAKVVGGFQMVDKNEADDKIVGILDNDPLWGKFEDLTDLPDNLVSRLKHYFLTYKEPATEGMQKNPVIIPNVYGKEHAHAVILAAMKDYREMLSVSNPV